jgi:hypothetical protein
MCNLVPLQNYTWLVLYFKVIVSPVDLARRTGITLNIRLDSIRFPRSEPVKMVLNKVDVEVSNRGSETDSGVDSCCSTVKNEVEYRIATHLLSQISAQPQARSSPA